MTNEKAIEWLEVLIKSNENKPLNRNVLKYAQQALMDRAGIVTSCERCKYEDAAMHDGPCKYCRNCYENKFEVRMNEEDFKRKDKDEIARMIADCACCIYRSDENDKCNKNCEEGILAWMNSEV